MWEEVGVQGKNMEPPQRPPGDSNLEPSSWVAAVLTSAPMILTQREGLCLQRSAADYVFLRSERHTAAVVRESSLNSGWCGRMRDRNLLFELYLFGKWNPPRRDYLRLRPRQRHERDPLRRSKQDYRDGRRPIAVILPLDQRVALFETAVSLAPSVQTDMQALKWTGWVSPDPNAVRGSCNSLKLIALEAGCSDLTMSRWQRLPSGQSYSDGSLENKSGGTPRGKEAWNANLTLKKLVENFV